jgi:hypothetical protein
MFIFYSFQKYNMVELRTELNPFRMVFGKDKSVELMVKVTNDSDKARTISCEIVLSENLSFEKNGRGTSKILRLGKMKPNENNLQYFTIFPKPSITKTEQPIAISVAEHYEDNYEYILNSKTKNLSLRIE